MRKLACIILLLYAYSASGRTLMDRDYLIFGQNTLQRITYETSSSFSDIHRGDKALDSDRGTSWTSKKEKTPHWITIDFGAKRLLSRITVYPGKKDNYRTIKYFTLQFLYMDNWFDYVTVNLEDSIKKTYIEKAEIDLGGIDASTFRIFIPPDAAYNDIAAIAEIETYLGSGRIKYFDERLKGLCMPIKNGFLPDTDYGYPNAPRNYRGGTHVGIDISFYHTDVSYDPVPVTKNTPVFSIEEGTIIRCDLDYEPMSLEYWKDLSAYTKTHPRTFVMRSFGGRQIWIDHRNGIVSAYNHLSKIDPDLKAGTRVKKGERIGWVGNSGLRGEVEGKDYGVHLHIEIWVDSYYLGHGMSMEDIRKYVKWIFFPLQ